MDAPRHEVWTLPMLIELGKLPGALSHRLNELRNAPGFLDQLVLGRKAAEAIVASQRGRTSRGLLRVVCHECSWSIQLHATVQEMKEGPSGSAIMG